MKATKQHIVDGIAAYIREEMLPKMEKEKAMQIMLTVAVNAVKANDKLIDAVFANEYVQAFLQDDGTGRYEIGGLLDTIRAAVDQYGEFPLTIPPVPLIAPAGGSIKLNAQDVDAIRRRIESAEANA
ncbi:MAG: hypothetical protein IJS41_01380 [Clostridia bacterium]|nr:hypothetical protein [Clostridia bacterium]